MEQIGRIRQIGRARGGMMGVCRWWGAILEGYFLLFDLLYLQVPLGTVFRERGVYSFGL